jgi:hypothetical protein
LQAGAEARPTGPLSEEKGRQKTIIYHSEPSKNLSFEAAGILHSAALCSE